MAVGAGKSGARDGCSRRRKKGRDKTGLRSPRTSASDGLYFEMIAFRESISAAFFGSLRQPRSGRGSSSTHPATIGGDRAGPAAEKRAANKKKEPAEEKGVLLSASVLSAVPAVARQERTQHSHVSAASLEACGLLG